MKVILLKDVPQLGRKDEIKNVADGFGRNYLLPKGLAVAATEQVQKAADESRVKLSIEAEKALQETQKSAEEIEGLTLVIKSKANEKGDLYAQVHESDIVKKLKELGFSVSAKQIKIDEPIKRTGEYKVPIVFSEGIEAEVKAIVEPQG